MPSTMEENYTHVIMKLKAMDFKIKDKKSERHGNWKAVSVVDFSNSILEPKEQWNNASKILRKNDL